MNTRKFLVVTSFLLVLAIALLVIVTTARAATVPYGTLEITIVDESLFLVKATGTYEGTLDWQSRVSWGHDNKEFYLPGTSGEFSEPHVFPGYGTYYIFLEVIGESDTYTVKKSVTFVKPPAPTPTGSLKVELVPGLKRTVKASGSYCNSLDWGTWLYWDDGSAVNPPGTCGDYLEYHTYTADGDYTVKLIVMGTELELMVPVTVTIGSIPPPPVGDFKIFLPIAIKSEVPPWCEIVVSGSQHDYQLTINWRDALEEWWTLFLGDDDETGEEPPGFFGSGGTETFPHVYNSGIWEPHATIAGPQGDYTCTAGVMVP